MQRGRENLPHVVAGTVRPVRKAISFLTKERDMVYCGQQASLGSIIIQKTDAQHRRNGADRNLASMPLTLSDFDAACKAITGHEFPEETLKVVVRPNDELMSRLLKLHETVGDIAETTPDVLALISRALEQQLIHLMIRCLTDTGISKISSGVLRHEIIVARFEEFLGANPDRPLDGDLRCDRRRGAHAPRRLRRASGNGADPLSLLAKNASCPARALAR
jgi:hypothetical protein